MYNLKIKSLSIFNNLFFRYPIIVNLREVILSSISIFLKNYLSGGKILICGNGGSGADSEHIVGELLKGFVLNRTISNSLLLKFEEKFPDDKNDFYMNLQNPIPAISLISQTAFISAYNNDKNSDFVYAQQVFAYAKKYDSLLCISTSGNSKNVINAAKMAKILEIPVISFTGNSGGKLKDLSDCLINVKSFITSEIQELHLPIYHSICMILEEELFGEN
jgi:D-sedoheptulose 7-phosphate isomerase